MNEKMTVEQRPNTGRGAFRSALRCLAVVPLVGLLLLLLAASGFADSAAPEATTLVLEPPAQMMAVGETVTTAVRVEDVTDLYTFEFRLAFDPTVVEGVEVEPGDFLSPDWQLDNTIDNENGTVAYALSQLNPAEPVSGSGTLAVVTWRGVAEGTSPITFTYVSLYARGGVAIPATGQGGEISVAEGESPPVVAGLDPESIVAGSPGFTLTVSGENFVGDSVVEWGGDPRPTTFVSGTELRAAIDAADIASGGTVDVRVVNPLAEGGTSAGATFTVTNPVPVIGSLTPVSASVGSGPFTLIVDGERFVEGSVVRWGGAPRPTTFVNSTRLRAEIAAGDLADQGVILVSVENPAPGGGTSNEVPFEVSEFAPAPYSNVIYLPMVTGGS